MDYEDRIVSERFPHAVWFDHGRYECDSLPGRPRGKEHRDGLGRIRLFEMPDGSVFTVGDIVGNWACSW